MFFYVTPVSMRSVLDNVKLLKEVHIPPMLLVIAAISGATLNLVFAIVPLLLISILTGIVPHLSWLLLPIPILQTAVFSLGLGLIISALAVFFVDIINIYDVLVRAFFYMTPIIYPVSILPQALQRLENGNPLFHTVVIFREALIDGKAASPDHLVIGTLLSIAMFAVGWLIFQSFADRF